MKEDLRNEKELVIILNDKICEEKVGSDLKAYLYYAILDEKSVFFINTDTSKSFEKRLEEKRYSDMYFGHGASERQIITSGYFKDKKELLNEHKEKYKELYINELDARNNFDKMEELLRILNGMTDLEKISIVGAYLDKEIANLTILLRRYFRHQNRNVTLRVSSEITVSKGTSFDSFGDGLCYGNYMKLLNAMAIDGIVIDSSLYKMKFVRRRHL